MRAHQLCGLAKVLKHHPEMLEKVSQAMDHEISCTEANKSGDGTNVMVADGSDWNDANTDGECYGWYDKKFTIKSSHNITPRDLFPLESDGRCRGTPDQFSDKRTEIMTRKENGVSGSWGVECGDRIRGSETVTTIATNFNVHQLDGTEAVERHWLRRGGDTQLQMNVVENADSHDARCDKHGDTGRNYIEQQNEG